MVWGIEREKEARDGDIRQLGMREWKGQEGEL